MKTQLKNLILSTAKEVGFYNLSQVTHMMEVHEFSKQEKKEIILALMALCEKPVNELDLVQ